MSTPLSNPTATTRYIGRFAPSPTGPLHFGSLISALASFLDARANRGTWLVRMEDIDPPREEAGAAANILHCLRTHGLHWDGDVMQQSQRHPIYRAAAQQLLDQHRAFYCTCSRSQLAGHNTYPGRCRDQFELPTQPYAIRLRVPAEVIDFNDAIQGHYAEFIDRAVGDFVIYRKEQLPAYQLAVVVDDAAQHVTHVVRGSDLLDNTARQIYLQRCLQLPTPQYAHVPVVANAHNQKLSKQTYARALDDASAKDNLCAALEFLGQTVTPAMREGSIEQLLETAIAQWSLTAVPRLRQLAGAQLPESCRRFAS